MIRAINKSDIPECVELIKESFMTVADKFGLTAENASRFTAFATTEDRLNYHFDTEHRPMFVFCDNDKIAGYYSLLVMDNDECELNNLCVLPSYRHHGIGEALLIHAFKTAIGYGCQKINIGIVEENTTLKNCYISFDFVHTGTQKFDFFPFTCGYMEKTL
ncbi:MAG: GNAT family N-acetyltransferase [Lachnospiraceae bacterium]|nr:GNAT family N-acetyltransferase [Lachnospiraceae bacterium]